MYIRQYAPGIKKALWPTWLLAIITLLTAGGIYRAAAFHLKGIAQKPIELPIPLGAFPTEVNGWEGTDITVAKEIEQAADYDDYVYRFYLLRPRQQWANIYVAYSARPRIMLGHHPRVCYVANGWVHDGSDRSQFLTSQGRQIPCSIHRFHKPSPNYSETVVLNFYILNGQAVRDEAVFSGLRWRTPNIAGNPARYVTQVQISSAMEQWVRAAAADLTETILDFVPDKNGKVYAEECNDIVSNIEK